LRSLSTVQGRLPGPDGRPFEHLGDGTEQLASSCPPARRDQHLVRIAIEGRIVRHAPGDVLGLPGQLALAVGAGHDEDGRDVAELSGDRLIEQRPILSPSGLPFRTRRPPDQQVVGAVGAGDQNFVHAIVLSQVRTLISAAVDHGQEVLPDRVGERLLE